MEEIQLVFALKDKQIKPNRFEGLQIDYARNTLRHTYVFDTNKRLLKEVAHQSYE